MLATNILQFHLDPVDCAHRGSVHVHRNERTGQVWVECARCGQRGIAYAQCQGGHSPISLAAASFWAGDYAMCDRAYRYQRRTPDNPTAIQEMLYWRKRRGSSEEGA